MKIAAQYSLSVVPLFLLLGLISCILMITSEREEIRWGLNQEASSLVIGISELLPRDEIGPWHAGTISPSSAPFRSALEQLLTFHQARSIRIYPWPDPLGQAVLTLGESSLSEPVVLNEMEKQRLLRGEVLVKDHLLSGSSSPHLTAWGALRNAKNQMVGILAVDTGAEVLVNYFQGLRSYILYVLTGILALGLAVSLFTSFIITREIRGLSQTAGAFAAGSYEADLQPGIIREINIAGSTFQTLGSVLKALQDKSKRELVQGEQLHSEGDLALVYSDLSFPLLDKKIAGVEIAGRRLGRHTVGDFWGAVEREDGGVAVLGRIAEGKDLNLAATAAAAAAFLLQSVPSQSLREVLQQAKTLFPLETCTVIGWTSGDLQWQCYQVERFQTVDSPRLAVRSDELLLATTLFPAIENGIRRFIQSFPFPSAKGILEELCLCLGEGETGSMLALHRLLLRNDHPGA